MQLQSGENLKSIILLSLNSSRLHPYLTNGGQTLQMTKDIKLDVFVFDTFESLNGLFFNERNILGQSILTEQTIDQINKTLVEINLKNRHLMRFSNMQSALTAYMSAVYNEYYRNPSFKRHCSSQIFQNLQPKLRSVDIINHKDPRLEIIAPFLLAEIAFYLFLFDKQEYDAIYGLEAEMKIIADIKNGKYEAFARFINKKVEHQKIVVEYA